MNVFLKINLIIIIYQIMIFGDKCFFLCKDKRFVCFYVRMNGLFVFSVRMFIYSYLFIFCKDDLKKKQVYLHGLHRLTFLCRDKWSIFLHGSMVCI